VGVYGAQALHSVRFATARLIVAFALGVLFLSLLFFVVPPIAAWRSSLLYATAIAFVLLVATRAILRELLGGERFKRRLLVLGAGRRAGRIAELAARPGANFRIVGFVGMNDGPAVIEGAVNRALIDSLA